MPSDIESIEREAASFLERSMKRAERAGGFGCFAGLLLVGTAIVTTPLHAGVGILVAAVAALVILIASAKRATRQSAEDFRRTFSPLANEGARRRIAEMYLQRQVEKHSSTKAGRMAKELLAAATKAREHAPEFKRDLTDVKRDAAEALRSMRAKVIVEAPPPRGERTSSAAPGGTPASATRTSAPVPAPAPAKARIEIELPDVGPLRERAHEVQAQYERVVEALRPGPKPAPPAPPPIASPQSGPPPIGPQHDARAPARQAPEHDARAPARPAPRAPDAIPVRQPQAPAQPASAARDTQTAGMTPVPTPTPTPSAGAPRTGTTICGYCGTPRPASDPSATCPTCFPQIQLGS